MVLLRSSVRTTVHVQNYVLLEQVTTSQNFPLSYLHTIDSLDSNLRYFFINSDIQLILLLLSTVHFFFFMIGASPAGFNKTSTKICLKHCREMLYKFNYLTSVVYLILLFGWEKNYN